MCPAIHLVLTVRNVPLGKVPVPQTILLDFIFYLKKSFYPSLNGLRLYFSWFLWAFEEARGGWLPGVTEWTPEKAELPTRQSLLRK